MAHTVVRDYFGGHVTETGLSGRDTRNLFHQGGKESRTTVSLVWEYQGPVQE